MREDSDTRPLIQTKFFQLEGHRVALGLLPKVIYAAVPGLILLAGGILVKRVMPTDLVWGATLLWIGGGLILLSLLAPGAAYMMARCLPRPTQRVEFFSHELDIVLAEGASRSIPLTEIQGIWEDGMNLCLLWNGETLEIPFTAFSTRWEMERAKSLVQSKLPDKSLKSLAS